MNIEILTLFPEMFDSVRTSMLGKALERGLLSLGTTDIRDFTRDKHNKTDDYPFGGGAGMVMMADPVFRALEALDAGKKRILYMSPKGSLLCKAKLEELAEEKELVMICGHYEGIDERIIEYWHAEEISIGDYILTGGEPAALVLIDAVARLIPGVLGNSDSVREESVYSGLLEHPQYTKPREYRGMKVPQVLLDGNHKMIDLWKFEKALEITRERRPDLFEEYIKDPGKLTKEERKLLEKMVDIV
ncbi:MAG: tRNA (guanosine(37)-N1)-methyltransferase TrmD [Eubacteriales bacterium]|nr:tRNA (guanosine(37)-N1)-methyltransferase TrmD [Eubacteriales bacterium]